MLGRVALAAPHTAVHTSCVHMWTRRRGARVVVCSNMEVNKEWEGGARHCKFFGLGQLRPTFDETMLGRVALAARDTAVHTSCVHMWTRLCGGKVVLCGRHVFLCSCFSA